MSNKIRLGMIGGGADSLIGVVHRIAASMMDEYALYGGAFSVDFEDTKKLAEKLDLDQNRIYPSFEEFVEGELKLPPDQRIQAVTVATPNFLHYDMSKRLIENGFHVICEKPITITATEAEELAQLVDKHEVHFCLTHTYTGYPMVREMRSLIRSGSIGKVQKVDAQYYQGWINPFIHDKEKRKQVWRLDPAKSGQSCCFGDIGVHAFNLIEYTTGLEVDKVLADLEYLYEDNPLDIDGTALLRLNNGSKGIVRASQIATAEENNIRIAVYGDKGGLKWEQENPNYLYHLAEGQPLRVIKPGYDFLSEFAQDSVKLPPGHPEGLFDAMGNIYNGMAKAIRDKSYTSGAFPNVQDGVRGMRFIEAVLESHKSEQAWVSL